MKTLAIMAAGLGTRYGGLKQLDTVDSDGNSIIDYSIYDAVRAGFNRIIFIIRQELLDDFVQRYSHLNDNDLTISYVYQDTSDVPDEFEELKREKPWGTGHALLALRNDVTSNFALINADDFYGKEAFEIMHDALYASNNEPSYYMVGYKLANTLSPFGFVSRGECDIEHPSTLKKVTERTKIRKIGSDIIYEETNGSTKTLENNTIVSMNFWGFSPSIFNHAESLFHDFLSNVSEGSNDEFFLPTIVTHLIDGKKASVRVLTTESTWHGITYKEDKDHLVNVIQTLKSSKVYPNSLWRSKKARFIFNQFDHGQKYKDHIELTSGHINDTFKIQTFAGPSFVLQKINSSIFPNVNQLMSNKISVSEHLNANSKYDTPRYFKTEKGNYLAIDSKGGQWTLCNYIMDSVVFTVPPNSKIVREAGKLLGDFHTSMESFEVASLFETIRDFHDLGFRLKQFEDSFKNSDVESITKARSDIENLEHFRSDAEFIYQLKKNGHIPIRVTHNDAKLSNMLFDTNSQNAVSMIDFDTIMPGIIHYDVGDALRSICSVAEEDEANLSKVLFDIDLYKVFMEGFLPQVKNSLTETEKETIPYSIKYMLYEQSLRFLTDFLNGNLYYKVDYPDHNLVRARNQIQLLQVVSDYFDALEAITRDLLEY